MPRLAVIDDSWEVRDPSTESYFFLAQRLFSPDGLLREGRAIPMLQCFDKPEVSGIVDNGAYEGELLSSNQLASLIAFGVRVSGSKPLPVFVPPDYPGQPFNKTLASYISLRESVSSTVKLMLIPHSLPGATEAYSRACMNAAQGILEGDWLGISILATPLALSGRGLFGVDRASFGYGPERQRTHILELLPLDFWKLVADRKIKLHLLGLGWDWWQLADNPFLDKFQSIDTHKPATYAKVCQFMEPWKVVDRRHVIHPSAIVPDGSPQEPIFKANVEVLQQLLGNR